MTDPKMPPKRRDIPPLSSFDPRFKDLLVLGSTKEHELEFKTRGEATAFRHRLHTYRRAVKEHFGDAHRGEWEPLYGCVVTVGQAQKRHFVYLKPRDQQYDDVLRNIPSLSLPTVEGGGDQLLEQIEKDVKDGS